MNSLDEWNEQMIAEETQRAGVLKTTYRVKSRSGQNREWFYPAASEFQGRDDAEYAIKAFKMLWPGNEYEIEETE